MQKTYITSGFSITYLSCYPSLFLLACNRLRIWVIGASFEASFICNNFLFFSHASCTALHTTVHNEAGDHQGRPPSPSSPVGKTGFSSIMRIATTAAKQAMTAANQRLDPNAPFPLRCCLMSLSLPWDALASDLLFKVLTTKSHNCSYTLTRICSCL